MELVAPDLTRPDSCCHFYLPNYSYAPLFDVGVHGEGGINRTLGAHWMVDWEMFGRDVDALSDQVIGCTLMCTTTLPTSTLNPNHLCLAGMCRCLSVFLSLSSSHMSSNAKYEDRFLTSSWL